ncbi:MAG: hypothetical protein KatS3mg002_0610 [Candidatus Woesearchaeota archaeon]|nr:MAG: hypothetical protein KatS3mg002_0610 [Candidatus Woesearchaeota archaeon]
MKSRKTKQKELLEKELISIKDFFNAEELYKKVKEKGIGIATIYRFLNMKVKNRELHKYFCEGRTIYSMSLNNHCHYTCQLCGRKEHIIIRDITPIKKNINGTICHFQIDVTGICGVCLKKKKTPEKAPEKTP